MGLTLQDIERVETKLNLNKQEFEKLNSVLKKIEVEEIDFITKVELCSPDEKRLNELNLMKVKERIEQNKLASKEVEKRIAGLEKELIELNRRGGKKRRVEIQGEIAELKEKAKEQCQNWNQKIIELVEIQRAFIDLKNDLQSFIKELQKRIDFIEIYPVGVFKQGLESKLHSSTNFLDNSGLKLETEFNEFDSTEITIKFAELRGLIEKWNKKVSELDTLLVEIRETNRRIEALTFELADKPTAIINNLNRLPGSLNAKLNRHSRFDGGGLLIETLEQNLNEFIKTSRAA